MRPLIAMNYKRSGFALTHPLSRRARPPLETVFTKALGIFTLIKKDYLDIARKSNLISKSVSITNDVWLRKVNHRNESHQVIGLDMAIKTSGSINKSR